MSKNNLFKLMFVALFSMAAFTLSSCEDNKAADIKAPVLLASPSVLEISDESPRGAVVVQADCSWTVNAPEWIDVTPMSGVGNQTIEVSVDPEIYDYANVATLTFTLYHEEFGEWGKADSKVKVSYSAKGIVPVDPDAEPIYFNDFDKEEATKTYGTGTSWPYLDQFEGWKNEQGTGVEGVTYKFSGMSTRANSTSDSSYSDYAGSGKNNLFFGSSAYFTVENIALSTPHLELSFGSEKYSQDNGSTFNPDEFVITLSQDGVNWSAPIEYDASLIMAKEGTWNLANASFSLPEGTTTLFVKIAVSVPSSYRLDDLKLMPG
ncbi:MAG: BACON domain-containing protein, partial [Alistipes sp.]|nr:BACON domain-containing protein [Alistipes sp.]